MKSLLNKKNAIRKKRLSPPPHDGGLSAKQIKQLRSAIRQVWSWSPARKICIARATDAKGFGHCEICKKKVPKLFADHLKACGGVLAPDYLPRMFGSSKTLQAICKKCHDRKTREERSFEKYGF